jgi:uncharacterized membrane protein
MVNDAVIDFRCARCGKLLRAMADTAGRQSRCPECGNIQQIPTYGTTGQQPVSPQAGNPFQVPPPAPGYAESTPYRATMPPWHAQQGSLVAARISAGEVLDRAWSIFVANLGPSILGALVFLMAVAPLYAAMAIVLGGLKLSGASQAAQNMVLYAVSIPSGIFALWLTLGLFRYFLKIARGAEPTLGDIFSAGRYLLRGFLAHVVSQIVVVGAAFSVVVIWMIALVVVMIGQGNVSLASVLLLVGAYATAGLVGFAVQLLFAEAYPLIVDREAGVLDALWGSVQLVWTNFGPMVLLALVGLLVLALGLAACLVGTLFTLPFLFLAWVVAYLRMTGQPTADMFVGLPGPALPSSALPPSAT